MLIGIDANEANISQRVGIGRYAYQVLKGIYSLQEKSKENIEFDIYLKSKPLADLPKQKTGWRYLELKPPQLWTRFALPLYLNIYGRKMALFFSTSHYLPPFVKLKSVISVMDLSYLHYPQMFKLSDLYKLKYWTAMSVKKARKIITISNFSKNEIIKYYSVDPDKIIVAYPGVDRKKYKPKRTLNKKDYILYVGTLQPRKNITGLIEAFSRLENINKLRLLIVGQKGWLYKDIFNQVRKRGLENKIIFPNYVTENQLISYYQEALCLVLPSFYEGFGIPVIEAMACGCPVIAASSSSLPEIVGQSGLLVNPNNIDQLAKAIEQISYDESFRNNLVKKGFLRIKDFQWEKTAEIIYTTLINTAL
ncbi:hypothetical protein A2W14_07120 [Candidatus Gottesmanbacteria bacterium RBG_16_37_8]|uniref:Glycosyl transferase family 1 domain-containing protein n=1 Tax=Candidatus Gottesmanbacteria bacterium RBG_16_37_8 TaxID=1798371 RepID=A0A1F5YVY4_9BACT|nr:MAG: hypothetical protein A2W14_07120 [Candidatus Gottesmanbacteria bacterium RBG_16_37_8]